MDVTQGFNHSEVVFGYDAAMLRNQKEHFALWLSQQALPLWAEQGHCAKSGRFFEFLTADGKADRKAAVRSRVPPRQVYSFALAHQKGWRHPHSPALMNAFDLYLQRYKLESGYVAGLCDAQGAVLDEAFDLYNQAFVLLALAEMSRVYPQRRAEFEADALHLLGLIQQDYQHPLGGYYSRARDQQTLESNPHMHFLEAALAWEAVAQSPASWAALADELAELAIARFIDRDIGALHEFFTPDWEIATDAERDVVEPGHQFEWAWLLMRWSVLRQRVDVRAIAERLYVIGRDHGVNGNGLAFMSMTSDLAAKDASVRLWPQTEWIKAASILATNSVGSQRISYLADVVRACQALSVFLDVPTAGSWLDRLDQSGAVLDKKAPASSFYHIICALYELAELEV